MKNDKFVKYISYPMISIILLKSSFKYSVFEVNTKVFLTSWSDLPAHIRHLTLSSPQYHILVNHFHANLLRILWVSPHCYHQLISNWLPTNLIIFILYDNLIKHLRADLKLRLCIIVGLNIFRYHLQSVTQI